MEQPALIEVTAQGTVRLVLTGPLVLVHHADVLTRLEEALTAASSTHVSIDLTGVTSLDSSGIALLLLVRRCARRAGKTFHLQGIRADVLRLLDQAGLTVFFGLQPPDSAAVAPTATSGRRQTDLSEILDERFDRDSLAAIRRRLSDYAAGAALPEQDRYHLLLAVTEMMTNSVRHGGGSGSVTVTGRDNLLFITVSDSGRGIPRRYRGDRPRPGPGAIGLYGLWLVRQICHRVDISTGPRGTTVQLTFALNTG